MSCQINKNLPVIFNGSFCKVGCCNSLLLGNYFDWEREDIPYGHSEAFNDVSQPEEEKDARQFF